MNFYICVYRQKIPEKRDWKRAYENASGDPVLKEYVRRYENRFKKNKDGIGRFYDWGDDPAFFAAEKFDGNVTWGVCRHDVRGKLDKEDVVVFICAQEQENQKPRKWKYYYVGLGTVGEVVKPRERLWKKRCYREYRKFYNLLIDSKGCHREPIDYHHDWADRLAARYIIFDDAPDKTHFNITNPLYVATYTEYENAGEKGILERWCLSYKRVNKIAELVGERDIGSRLRTTNKYHPHKEMNLATRKRVKLGEKQLKEKRQEFLKISRAVAGES